MACVSDQALRLLLGPYACSSRIKCPHVHHVRVRVHLQLRRHCFLFPRPASAPLLCFFTQRRSSRVRRRWNAHHPRHQPAVGRSASGQAGPVPDRSRPQKPSPCSECDVVHVHADVLFWRSWGQAHAVAMASVSFTDHHSIIVAARSIPYVKPSVHLRRVPLILHAEPV